ncbi:TrbG/VirB9 family P-type conjugative transfer protein, partial [Nitrosomonas eutropha]
VSMNSFSFAVIVSQKMRQMRAEPVSNASYYTYTIKLASTKNDWMPILSFDYPDDIQREWAAYHLRKTQVVQTNTMPATGQNLAALDFNYNLSGDNPSWKPVRIYTDGIKTYIQFPSTHFNESPALLSLGNSGDEELVNYRLIGDRYVVDKVLDRAALIVGVGLSQTKVEIIRKEGSK